MTALLTDHLAEAAQAHPDVQQSLSDAGTSVVTLRLPLPPGWSADSVLVRIVLPAAFPMAAPDCFYADPGLTLAGGAAPSNTALQPLSGALLMWFSWHVAAWDPSRDRLLSYIRFVERRLADAR